MAAPYSITVCLSPFFGIHQTYSTVHPHPHPHFSAPQALSHHLFKKKNNSGSWQPFWANRVFFCVFCSKKKGISSSGFLNWTQAVFQVPKKFSWWMTGVLWEGRVYESASVGIHAASLVISQTLLWAAWPGPSIRGTRKIEEWRCLITLIIPALVEQHISGFCLKHKRGESIHWLVKLPIVPAYFLLFSTLRDLPSCSVYPHRGD